MKHLSPHVDVVLTTDLDKAKKKYVEKGFEPIEWSAGDITLVGEHLLDHHGRYSNMPSVAVRGQGELFRKGKHKYIINHIDADIIVAIAGLEGIRIPYALTELIAEIDVKGRHRVNWHNTPYRGKLVTLWEYLRTATSHITTAVMTPSSSDGRGGGGGGGGSGGGGEVSVTEIIDHAIDILTNPYTYEDKYREYMDKVEEGLRCIKAIDEFDLPIATAAIGSRSSSSSRQPIRIALAIGDSEAGFEAWYTQADIVVAYSPKRGKATVGAVDEAVAELAFNSKRGLLEFTTILGQGWGGRPTIIGSPRDKSITKADVYEVYGKLVDTLKKRASHFYETESYIG